MRTCRRVVGALALAAIMAGCTTQLTPDVRPPQVPGAGDSRPNAGSQQPSTHGEQSNSGSAQPSTDSEQPNTGEEKPSAEPMQAGCTSLDLSKLKLRPDQNGPATVAYGSRIIGAAAVDAGEGYEIVAVRLAEPTGPGRQDKVAWIRRAGDVKGWLVPISEKWQGAGLPDGDVLDGGPEARATALGCL